MIRNFLLIAGFALLPSLDPIPECHGQQVPRGYVRDMKVSAETSLDWVFSLANQSPVKPPADWLPDYRSADQTYELYVPERYSERKSWPVVLFISPGNRGTGFNQWREACRRRGIIFASPHDAGNGTPGPRRVRIVMDVLDDLRRRFKTDTDRTYIGGFSGGGRIACQIAFALPEYFGGVLPVCAGGDLRPESWLRQRVVNRLSVAQLTGTTDFNRGECERLHQTELSGVGVRIRTWVAPRTGHAVPNDAVFNEAFDWLEEPLDDRRSLAKKWPASRLTESLSRDEWADRLLAEGLKRLQEPETLYSGLMQLKGVYVRWNGLPQSAAALKTLTEYEQKPERPWDKEDIAEQRRFLIARARGVDAYASGPLPKQYEKQKPNLIKGAMNLWAQVLQDGQDEKATEEARVRIPKLQAMLDE